MTVSSHLTPEPERRLWIILERIGRDLELLDWKIGAATALAAVELLWLKSLFGFGPFSWLAAGPLCAALPLGVFAFSPLSRPPKWLLSALTDEHGVHDSLVAAEDLAGYSHNELVHRLDKYLGGGITATPYYEDIVGRILAEARETARKRRLFRILCWTLGSGQIGLILRLIFAR